MFAASLMVASLLAMGPQWAVVDLPYPEVTEMNSSGGSGAPTAQALVAEAALGYARSRKPGTRKPEVAQVRVDGPRASAVLSFGDRVEPLTLSLVNGEWKVVETK